MVYTSNTYSVSVVDVNGCTGVSSGTSVTVHSNPVPTIIANGDLAFCDGDSLRLTSSLASNYTWSTGATTQSIYVHSAGKYAVTVIDAFGCTGASDSTEITIYTNPTPTLSVPGDTAFCSGGDVTLSVSASTSYVWSTGALSQSIITSTPGEYWAIVTDANGCSGNSDTTTVIVYPNPTPTITPNGPTEFCQGGNVTLTTEPAASYLWSTGATTQSIVVTTSGFYSVSVVSVNGCSGSSQPINVIVNDLPSSFIFADGPTEFCDGDSVNLVARQADSYLWSTGETTQIITVTTSDTYFVTVTDANGCTQKSNTIAVTVNPNPTPTISADGPLAFCDGEDVLLTVSGSGTYEWSTGEVTKSITVELPGQYWATVTTVKGCSGISDTATVEVWDLPEPVVSLDGPPSFCNGDTVFLISTPAETYLWSNGDTTQTTFALVSGSYDVTVTDTNGCGATSFPVIVDINGNPNPTVTPSGTVEICAGDSILITSAVAESYLWSTGDTTQSILVWYADTISVFATDANGCSGTSADVITVVNALPTPTVIPDGPVEFCNGGSVGLSTQAYSSYVWSTGTIGQGITVSNSGNYSVAVVDANGCAATSPDLVVTVNQPPVVSITPSGPTQFCQGDSVVLTATAGEEYLWSNGAKTRSITVYTSGSFEVDVTDINGCVGPSPLTTIEVYPLPNANVIADGPTEFCDGDSVVLAAIGGTTFEWNTGSTAKSIVVDTTGSFYVIATNQFGCVDTSSTVETQVNEIPVVIVVPSGPTEFCEGESVTLVASGSDDFFWSTGQTGSNITVSTSGVYSVVGSNANGCGSPSPDVTVVVHPNPVVTITPSGALEFCAGDSVVLTSSVSDSYLWSTGDTTQSITVFGTGDYDVTVTDTNSCSTVADVIAVVVHDNPTPVISPATSLEFCAGDSAILISSVGEKYAWSNGDTTQFITVSSGGDYIVTVTNEYGCEGISDTATVVVNPNPTPVISPNGSLEFCAGDNVELSVPASSSYAWNNGATDQTITVSNSGLFWATVTDANGCSGISDTVSVIVNTNPQPTITADGPTKFCEGDSVTLTASVAASYLWSTGDTTQAITVYTDNIYTVSVVDANGCEGVSPSVPVVVFNNPIAEIVAAGPTSFCKGGEVVLYASSGKTRLWNTGETTQSIVADTSGLYSVTITDANGCSDDSDPINVTVYDNPTVSISAGGPTEFCEGDDVTLTANGGSTYHWNTGALSQSIVVTQPGDYWAVVSDANGCPGNTDTINVIVHPNPTPTITPDGPTEFCQGNSVTLTASDAASYSWTTTATTQSIVVSTAGFFAVTVVDTNGCSATSTPINVIVNTPPSSFIFASGATEFCEGDSVDLVARPADNYLWSNGETTRVITVKQSGAYSVTNVDENGCQQVSNVITVIVNPTPAPTISANGPLTFCDGDDVVLTLTGALNYLWNTGDVSQSITATQAGSYWASVTNIKGCSGVSDTVDVDVWSLPTPVVSTFGEPSFCSGDTVFLTSTPAESYLWSSGDTTQNIFALVSGSYSVTVTDTNGCQGTSPSAVVDITDSPKPTTTPSGQIDVCDGDTITITSASAASYLWNTGETTQSIKVTTGGIYNVYATDANGCSGTSADATVDYNPNPDPTIVPDGPTEFCTGGTVNLSTQTFDGYNWSTGASGQTISVSKSGDYTVTVENEFGCTATSPELTVTVHENPIVGISTNGPTQFCQGDSVVLTATEGASYEWSNGATTQSITVYTSGSFTVEVTDQYGCVGTSKLKTIEVYPKPVASIEVSGDTEFCAGDSLFISAAGGQTYEWSTGETGSAIVVYTSGDYFAVAANQFGCKDTSAVVKVVVNEPPTVGTFPFLPTILCAGDTLTITASGADTYLWSTGETGPSIDVTTSGNFSVTGTVLNGCGTISDTVEITIGDLPEPIVDINGPTEFCAGDSTILSTGDFEAYLWSSGDTTQSIVVYGPGDYSVTVWNENACHAESAPVNIGLLHFTPTIELSGPEAFCQGDSVVLTSSQADNYIWSTGDTTQSITVFTAGKYAVSVWDDLGCEGTSDSLPITVFELPQPDITAGGPTEFCFGNTVELTSSVGQSYSWNTQAITQSITVGTSGTYTVQVTDEKGCTGEASMDITVNPLPTPLPVITADGPTTFCDGDSVNLSVDQWDGYQWSNGDTTQSIWVKNSDLYVVTVTNEFGCEAEAEGEVIVVNPNPRPIIQTSGDGDICQGDSITLITDIYNHTEWSTGDTTQSIVVDQADDYIVTVTNSFGCMGSDTFTVTISPVPEVSILVDETTVCPGTEVIMTAVGDGPYLWSTKETTKSILVVDPGKYTVEVTNAQTGCSFAPDSVEIINFSVEPPVIEVGGPINFCEGDSVTLYAFGVDFDWSSGQSESSIVVRESGDYSVNVTDQNGCVTPSDTVAVTVYNNLVPVITTIGSPEFCNGDSVVLTVNEFEYYLWSPSGDTTNSITVYSSETVMVSVTDTNGCTATTDDFVTLEFEESVVEVLYEGEIPFCQGGELELSASSGETFEWLPNLEETQSIVVTEAGTYTVNVLDGNGCPATDSVQVEVFELPSVSVELQGPIKFCEGESVDLKAISQNVVTYQWLENSQDIFEATSEMLTVSNESLYEVVVTDTNGCVSSAEAPTAIIGPAPVAAIGEDQSICPGDSIVLTASGGDFYEWSNGLMEASITVSPEQSTAYSVVVTNENCGLESSDTVTVDLLPSPLALIEADTSGWLKHYIEFVDASGDQSIVSWFWDFGDGASSETQNPEHMYEEENQFDVVLIVENEEGCKDVDTVQVRIFQNIIIPNVFTPNDDDFNDELVVENNGVNSYEITIYNRWGQVVYHDATGEVYWDGRSPDGAESPAGTYYYVLKVDNDFSEGSFEQTGYVTLIR
ncbi:gliding motility-associated C-terminal domain-containing protein [Bacteroidota bacterium]